MIVSRDTMKVRLREQHIRSVPCSESFVGKRAGNSAAGGSGLLWFLSTALKVDDDVTENTGRYNVPRFRTSLSKLGIIPAVQSLRRTLPSQWLSLAFSRFCVLSFKITKNRLIPCHPGRIPFTAATQVSIDALAIFPEFFWDHTGDTPFLAMNLRFFVTS